VYTKAFPLVDGKPTLGGRIECQEALIFYGLRHNGPKITEDAVSKWLQETVEKGGSIYAPLSQAIVALLASGVLGWNPPLADDEDDEGKEQAVPEQEQAVSARAVRAATEVTPIKRTG
jgi:hypothetical protein